MKNTASVTIVDVEIRERTVEVPLACPHCEASLATETYETTILTVSIDEVDDFGYVESGPGLDAPTVSPQERREDTGLGYRNIICVACDKSVIDQPGTLTTIQAA